jgi:preprotein translocase subunit SecG
MSFFAGILTFILIINCLLLILLILVQLPKKDAGAGLAFGGGAADALFGAGSGNVLTKITKWATIVFLGMAIVLGMIESSLHNRNGVSDFEKRVGAGSPATLSLPPASTSPSKPAVAVATNQPLLLTPTTLLSSNASAVPVPAK